MAAQRLLCNIPFIFLECDPHATLVQAGGNLVTASAGLKKITDIFRNADNLQTKAYNTWSKPKTANCQTRSEELCGVIQSDALVHNLYGEVRHSQLRCYPLPDRHDLLQLGLGCRTLNGPVAASPEPPRVCG